jgi:sporulation protein YlmC with PRC-barrel domain
LDNAVPGTDQLEDNAMKLAIVTGALFLITAGHALAGPGAGEPKEPADPTSGRPGAVLDEAKCASVWSLTEREGDTLSEAKATPFVVNFKLVDANADGKISEAEFKDGCKKGLVQEAAAEGAPEPSGAMAPQSGEQPAGLATSTDALEKEISPAAASGAQDNAQFVTSVPAEALSIRTYYNEDVYDNQDNKIGVVNDILLDKDGRVSTVIIGAGGFLGVGEKDVAVPFTALKVAEKAGDRYLVINATKEALEKAPGYIYDEVKGVWVPAKEG